MRRNSGRAERRRATWRFACRTQREHLRIAHPDGAPGCTCELSPLFFAKGKVLGCNCRGREAGNPKYGRGICCRTLRPAVAARIAWRKERFRWMHLVGDGDDRWALC